MRIIATYSETELRARYGSLLSHHTIQYCRDAGPPQLSLNIPSQQTCWLNADYVVVFLSRSPTIWGSRGLPSLFTESPCVVVLIIGRCREHDSQATGSGRARGNLMSGASLRASEDLDKTTIPYFSPSKLSLCHLRISIHGIQRQFLVSPSLSRVFLLKPIAMPPSEHELDLTEDDPFLNGDERSDAGSLHSHPEPQIRFRTSRWQLKTPRQVIIMLAVIKFSVVCAGMMLLLPLARLIEDLFCHAYYKDNSLDIIDEMKCKVEEIQSRMAYLNGWSGILGSVIGMKYYSTRKSMM